MMESPEQREAGRLAEQIAKTHREWAERGLKRFHPIRRTLPLGVIAEEHEGLCSEVYRLRHEVEMHKEDARQFSDEMVRLQKENARLRAALEVKPAPKPAPASRKVESMEEARLIAELFDMPMQRKGARTIVGEVHVERNARGWRMWDAARERWTSRKQVARNAARWILKRSGNA